MSPAGFGANGPRASVVMCVYNDLRFLDEAVSSVLQQQFADFEFVIVDDGTQADTVRRLAARDPRITVVVNERNTGAAAAGNHGIAAARSDIIVRLDADDVAEPARIGCLLAELEREPELGLVGSAVTLIDEAGRPHGVQPMPETDVEIRWTILFHNPFYHSSIAFRRSCFEATGGYKEDEPVAHDHYLWFAMLDGCRARNLSEPLVRYRVNPRGLTAQHATGSPRRRTHAIREQLWARLGLTYALYDDELAAVISRFLRGFEIDAVRRGPAYEVILTALHAFAAEMRSRARLGEDDALRRLVRGLVTRMLDERPASSGEQRRIARLCADLEL